MNKFTLDQPKPFAWSYTRYKKWRTCPRQYNHYEVLKDIQQAPSKALDDGDRLHAAFQRRVEQNLPMPTAYKHLNDWGDELVKVIHPKQKIFVEREFALTRELKPTGWFDKNAWFRYRIDHLKLFPYHDNKMAALAIDFKTGKPDKDNIQLALGAQIIFSHWEAVQVVRTEYWWTKTKEKDVEGFSRKDMVDLWDVLMPEISAMAEAHKTNNFPPKRNGLCKEYCGVTMCEFNGKYSGSKDGTNT